MRLERHNTSRRRLHELLQRDKRLGAASNARTVLRMERRWPLLGPVLCPPWVANGRTWKQKTSWLSSPY